MGFFEENLNQTVPEQDDLPEGESSLEEPLEEKQGEALPPVEQDGAESLMDVLGNEVSGEDSGGDSKQEDEQEQEEPPLEDDPYADDVPSDDVIDYIVINPEGDDAPVESENEEEAPMEPLPVDELDEEHDPVLDQLKGLGDKMDGLLLEFSGKLKYDAHKEKVIDALHQELQEHKEGLVRKYMQSMVLDLIKVVDDIRKIVRHYREKEAEEGDYSKFLDIVEGFPSDIEDIFSYQGVMAFRCDETDFDPKRQRVIQRIETDDESLDKKVAASLSPGYEWDGRLLRPEMVGVYSYKPVSEQFDN